MRVGFFIISRFILLANRLKYLKQAASRCPISVSFSGVSSDPFVMTARVKSTAHISPSSTRTLNTYHSQLQRYLSTATDSKVSSLCFSVLSRFPRNYQLSPLEEIFQVAIILNKVYLKSRNEPTA
jgi:hypothetical protein